MRFEIVPGARASRSRRRPSAAVSRRCSQSAIGSTITSSASGKRSRLANFSRSSTTWMRKPASCASSAEVPADVAGADDVELRGRRERIDVDVHLSAADEAVLLREVVVQLVVEQRAAAGGDRLARLPERVVLVAAAADRADRAAVGEDQHLGAGALRRRAVARARPSRARPPRRARARRPRRRGLPRSDRGPRSWISASGSR